MKNKYKNILMFITMMIYVPFTSWLILKSSSDKICEKINIVIKDSISYNFINSKEIYHYLFNKQFEILGKPLNKIDLLKIENFLLKKPEINTATVYITENGHLNIEIEQFKPIIKISDLNKNKYYLDFEGNILTSPNKPTPNVLIANGYIKPIFANTHNIYRCKSSVNVQIVYDLHELAKYIYNNNFWNAQVEQIYINKDKEFELIPRVGSHIIILGTIDNYMEKLNNLKLFYLEGLNKIGWNDYKYINLNFKNQIVCTKN